jgi:2-polyprenyl-3-methyl-5-hydroxy-6-metoxy-1,4-benzoquinol methylase
MSGFYRSIAGYYDDIFPYHPVQKRFVLSSCGGENKEKSVLDIGCGTGNLTLELSRDVGNITGIDADREMIRHARSKSEGYGNIVRFQCLDMMEITRHFTPGEFDLVLSFGNTLAHLPGPVEIRQFLEGTRSILSPGGCLLLQVVNFNRILSGNMDGLPPIENEKIRFERFYDYHKNSPVIDFRTILTVKKENRIIENSIPLFPVLNNELDNSIKKAGFKISIFYGGFAREPWTEKSPASVVEAH